MNLIKKSSISKPIYHVPSMREIEKIKWNGFRVISLFSGCGGSCLGYRMAGFKVVWANEFIQAAQDSYNANKAKDSTLDGRDIRIVQPEEILQATGLKKGELDVLDGSPPCQAFSTPGKRHKNWGKAKLYENGARQCNETLFYEYIRLLKGLQPKVFIAENVSGLVKGTAKGMFLEILRDLKACGYRVTCKVLDAQWLGVPQSRQRVIFIGVRNDLNLDPVFPKPLAYQYSVRDALPWILKIQNGNPQQKQNPGNRFPRGEIISADKRCPSHEVEAETDISRYAIGKEWDKLKEGGQSSKYFSLQKADRQNPSPTILACHGSAGIASVVHPTEKRKFSIAELKRICAFPDDFNLCGSYAQQWSCLGNSVPPTMMMQIAEVIRDCILKIRYENKTSS